MLNITPTSKLIDGTSVNMLFACWVALQAASILSSEKSHFFKKNLSGIP